MNIVDKAHLTTGKFCEIVKTTKHTLFHYDKIGLFSPCTVNDKGYRFYAEHQIDLFNIITLLKDTGLSLIEIKDYLDNRNPEKMLKLLNKIENDIDSKIKKLNNIQNFVKSKKNILSDSININLDEIKIINCPQKELLISKKIPENATEVEDTTIFQNFITALKDLVGVPFSIGGITDINRIKQNTSSPLSYYYLDLKHSQNNVDFHNKPAGNYVLFYHKGMINFDLTYKRVTAFLEKSGFKIKDEIYVDFIISDFEVFNTKDYITQLSIRVESLK